MSKMDTSTANQGGIVSSGSCYLMIPEIKGDWKVGPVTDGHAIIEYALGASKAVVPAENGIGLESARALGTLMTLTVMKSAHQAEFVSINAKGVNLPKITLINLKNHGVTADEVWRIELTNVRIRAVRANRKRQMGGYSSNPTAAKINQDRGVGWALDSDADHFAQTQDPNFQGQVVDVFEIDCSYSTVTMVHKEVKEDATTGGNTATFFDFIHNTTEPAA